MRTLTALTLTALLFGACGTTDEQTGEAAAYGVCKDFVKDRLRSPGSASFPNFFEDDGEVVVTKEGSITWRVVSHVDSENGFGASLRTGFVCEVSSTDGENFRLVDLTLL